MAEIPKNRLNSALNIPRTTCRLFSHSEKLRVVEAADRCTKPDTRPVNWGCYFDARVLFRRTWPTGVDGVCEFTQRFLPKISRQLMTRLVMRSNGLNARMRARGKVDGVLHHSDRGCAYASGQYRDRLDALGMRVSMSRAGDCWDNAIAESFFSMLEAELLCRNRFHGHAQAIVAVSEYIDHFFNPQRRHSTIGYISPIEYELRWQSLQLVA
jgi:hypothetical protein